MCDAGGAKPFVEWLGECVHSSRDTAGVVFGIASLCFWLVAQLPQIIRNIQTQQAGALSPYFLGEWLLGDTSNLIGCLLTGTQLASQTYTAMYYVFMDTVLIVQYNYYTSLQRRHERRYIAARARQQAAQERRRGRPVTRGSQGADEVRGSGAGGSAVVPGEVAARVPPAVPTRTLACIAVLALMQLGNEVAHLSTPSPVDEGWGAVLHRRLLGVGTAWGLPWLTDPRPAWAILAGQSMGYLSMVMYLGSRFSQIYKNWSRKSTEGLALTMFMAAIMANLFYGSSIIVRTYTWRQLLDSLPWILGSLGTVGLDVCILYQARLYKKRPGDDEALNPLLANAGE